MLISIKNIFKPIDLTKGKPYKQALTDITEFALQDDKVY